MADKKIETVVPGKVEVKAVPFVPVAVVQGSGKGTTRNAEARHALASSLFTKGLTFLGVLGRSMAIILLDGGTVTMPNGRQVTTSNLSCPFCGSWNGKQKQDSDRLALTSVFFSGSKDSKDSAAQYHFVSAGSSESCLAKYLAPSKVSNGDALKAAYGKLW